MCHIHEMKHRTLSKLNISVRYFMFSLSIGMQYTWQRCCSCFLLFIVQILKHYGKESYSIEIADGIWLRKCLILIAYQMKNTSNKMIPCIYNILKGRVFVVSIFILLPSNNVIIDAAAINNSKIVEKKQNRNNNNNEQLK